MNVRVISREGLPPYSTQQWLRISKGRNVVLYELDAVPPFKFFHNEVQKVVLVVDDNKNLVTVLMLEIVPYKALNFDTASIANVAVTSSVLLMYNTIKRNNAKVGVFSYVFGVGLLESSFKPNNDELIPYLSLSHINTDMFTLTQSIPAFNPPDRTVELSKEGISLKAGLGATEAVIFLASMVDDIQQLTNNGSQIVPPVIFDANTEKVGTCGAWSYATKQIKLQHSLFNKKARLCFYDKYEDAYCAVVFGAFKATLMKFENEKKLRCSLVDSYVTRDGKNMPSAVFHSLLTDTCTTDLIKCVGLIDWSNVFDWINQLY